jgi:hypothetical protein
MAAESNVSVANMALDHLKEEPITSLDLDTNSSMVESLCARYENISRRAALRKHSWNFATKYTTLLKMTDAPPHTWLSQYMLPTDYIRLIRLGNDSRRVNPPYEIAGNRLYTDAATYANQSGESLPFVYIMDFDDVPKMDPLFIRLWALEWAILMCPKLKGSESHLAGLLAMLRDMAPEAYSIDGQDRPPIRLNHSRAKAARRGFGRLGAAGPVMYFGD